MSGQTSSKLSMSLDELIAKSTKNSKNKKNLKNTSLSINRKKTILSPQKGVKKRNSARTVTSNNVNANANKVIKTINKARNDTKINNNASSNNSVNVGSKLYTIKVTGFGTDVDANILKSHFGVCGKVVKVNQTNPGVAYVGFAHPSGCAAALRDLDGTKVKGCVLTVQKGVPIASNVKGNTSSSNYPRASFQGGTFTRYNNYNNANNRGANNNTRGSVRTFINTNNGMYDNGNNTQYANANTAGVLRTSYVYDMNTNGYRNSAGNKPHMQNMSSNVNNAAIGVPSSVVGFSSSSSPSPFTVTNRLANNATGLIEKGAVNQATVIVSNVPLDLTAQEIQDAFCCVGAIARTEVLLNSNGKHTGRAAVVYESRAFAEEAVRRFDGGDLNNNKIRVFLE